jgi:cytidylate kinase
MSEPTRRVVIAIDGPSGAGKSTIGRALAEALSYTYLDTGAMYRAVAVRAIEKGIAAEDEAALAGAASSARITFDATGKRVLLDGRDVTEEIRTRDATRMASPGCAANSCASSRNSAGRAGLFSTAATSAAWCSHGPK